MLNSGKRNPGIIRRILFPSVSAVIIALLFSAGLREDTAPRADGRDFHRVFDVNYDLSMRGGWGPGRARIKHVGVYPDYINNVTSDGRCCRPAFFNLITSTRNASGRGYGYDGVIRIGRKGLIPLRGYSVLGPGTGNASVAFRVTLPTTGRLSPTARYIPRHFQTALVHRGLGTTLLQTGRKTSGRSGRVHFTFRPDFSISSSAAAPGIPRREIKADLKNLYLLDYIVRMARSPRFLDFHDIIVYTPGRGGGYQSINSHIPRNLLYEHGRRRYVFQTFIKLTGYGRSPNPNELRKVRVGIHRRDWDFSPNNMCTAERCALVPMRNITPDMRKQYSAMSTSIAGEPVVPARLSFRLARRDGARRWDLNTEGVELIVSAVRRSDGRRVNAVRKRALYNTVTSQTRRRRSSTSGPLVDEERLYLKLDDKPGTVYDLEYRVRHGGTEYSGRNLLLNRPLYQIKKAGSIGNRTVPSVTWNRPAREWTSHTVGRPIFGSRYRPVFDAYPLYTLYFKKPARVKSLIRFNLTGVMRVGKIKAKAVRKSDGRVFQGFTIAGRGHQIALRDFPGAEYTLSFYVRHQFRRIVPGAPAGRNRMAVMSVRVRETGRTYNPSSPGWRRFKTGERAVTNIDVVLGVPGFNRIRR